MNRCILSPPASIKAEGGRPIKSAWRTVRLPDGIAALLLLEQVGDHVAAGGQADLVALDFGHETARDEMVMLFMRFSSTRSTVPM
jgi:hypothetical protein